MKTFYIWGIALVLAIIGLALFAYKAYFLGFPLHPATSVRVWNVEARVNFVAKDEPVKASILVPMSTPRFAITGESFISSGYGILVSNEARNRQATWSIRKAGGRQNLYYQATVRSVRSTAMPPDEEPPKLSDPGFQGPAYEAATELLEEIKAKSADTVSMVSALLKALNEDPPRASVKLLLGEQPKPEKKVEIAVRLLAQADIIAVSVHGVRLREDKFDFSKNIPLLHWLEIYDKKKWISFNPINGKASIPQEWLGWWRGKQNPVSLEGGEKLRVRVAISPRLEEGMSDALERGSVSKPLLLKFSLFSLPVSTQAVYRVLLTIPVGALLLVIFRNVIGIKTFGTFMPVLIGLAFRETGIMWGIIMFSTIVVLGLTIRFWLERLKLLLVPRLAIILTVVVLLMTALSVLTHNLGIHRGLSVALFPMVIMTMTIERMSIVWEERGPWESLVSGLGSMLTAAVACLVMSVKIVEHLVFVFPELLLVLMAAMLLLGRYTGYRLMDLRRFKVFAGA